MKVAFLVGRTVFGGFFLYNGIHHFKDRKQLSQYAAAKAIPIPDFSVTASGALLLTGGMSILPGVKPKHGAPASFHFWPWLLS